MTAFALVALLGALAAGPAVSVDTAPGAGVLTKRLEGGISAKVGEWVSYRLTQQGGRVGYWRLAVVSEQKDRLGRDAVWVEMELDETPKFAAPLLQMRFLVARAEGLSNGITREIVAIGMGKPREVKLAPATPEAPAKSPAKVDFDRRQMHVRRGKPRSLMTAAGTVSARPTDLMYRRTVIERFWTSPRVPVLHLAKVELPGFVQSLEVQDYGIDAKPRIRMPDPSLPKITLDPPLPTVPTPGGSHASQPHSKAP